MLYIDDKNLEITNQKILIGKYVKNKENVYNIKIQLSFININNKETGYINLYVGFEKNNDIHCFLNKEYDGIPFEDDIIFEVFDTERFLDTEIESKISIKLKRIINNRVEAFFEINDELIKIKFDGFLDFQN